MPRMLKKSPTSHGWVSMRRMFRSTRRNLSDILAFVEQLNAVDTTRRGAARASARGDPAAARRHRQRNGRARSLPGRGAADRGRPVPGAEGDRVDAPCIAAVSTELAAGLRARRLFQRRADARLPGPGRAPRCGAELLRHRHRGRRRWRPRMPPMRGSGPVTPGR